MFEIHALSLVIGIAFGAAFVLVRVPWMGPVLGRRRMAWPSRSKLVRRKTRELREEVEKRIPPRNSASIDLVCIEDDHASCPDPSCHGGKCKHVIDAERAALRAAMERVGALRSVPEDRKWAEDDPDIWGHPFVYKEDGGYWVGDPTKLAKLIERGKIKLFAVEEDLRTQVWDKWVVLFPDSSRRIRMPIRERRA